MSDPIPFLDLPAQQKRLGKALKERVDRVFEHCRFVMGPEVSELEDKLSQYAGVRHAIGVSSGTDALLAVMMGENIGPGSAVFLPSFTYTATAEVVLLLGGTPVFVDVEEDTFQISISSLRTRYEDVINDGCLKPRAIIGVDLFGQPAPWQELRSFAEETGLSLVADCAQSFGASYKGRKLGREAKATTLSFFPSKPLGGYGDGGAILTDNDDLAALYRSLRSHGEGTLRYDVQRIGLNARLDSIQAAVLLSKLDIFDEELMKREEIAQTYDNALPTVIKAPCRVPHSQSAWAVYCITLVNKEARDSLQSFLKERGIPSAIYYPKPLHHQPAYASHHDGSSLPVSEALGNKVLALPLHPDLSECDMSRVTEALCQWAGGLV